MVSLRDSLKGRLSSKELEVLPRAFDIIGNIAIFSEFPKELEKKEKIIGNVLIKLNKNIRTVAKKTKVHGGKYRTKKIKIIAPAIYVGKVYGIINQYNDTVIKNCFINGRFSTGINLRKSFNQNPVNNSFLTWSVCYSYFSQICFNNCSFC